MQAGRTLAASSIAALGCFCQIACGGPSCDDYPCAPALQIDFENPLEGTGQYEVVAEIDGEEITCVVSLPRSGIDTCEEQGLNFAIRGNVTRNDDGDPTEAGDARNLVGVVVSGTPSDVSLRIEKSDEAIVSGSVAAMYEDVEFRGEGCGTCPRASASIGAP
jgi:hypothetical protein